MCPLHSSMKVSSFSLQQQLQLLSAAFPPPSASQYSAPACPWSFSFSPSLLPSWPSPTWHWTVSSLLALLQRRNTSSCGAIWRLSPSEVGVQVHKSIQG